MPTNWKTLAEKTNAKTYVLPQGWDSRAAVAQQLDCSEDKVDDHLRPALKSNQVVKQQFPVWDSTLGRKVMVVAYRDASKDLVQKSVEPEQVLALRKAGKSWPQCAKEVGISESACRRLAGVKS